MNSFHIANKNSQHLIRRPMLLGALCVSFVLVDIVAFKANASTVRSDWKDIKAPPLHSIKLQEPKRIELSNGMVILLQPDPELPLIQSEIWVHGGSTEEPKNKTGLVGLYGNIWVTGGSKTQTGDQLDDFFESHAINVSSSGGGDFTYLSFNCLKTDLDATLERILPLLRQPEFREEKLILAKQQLLTSLAAANDDPASLASREAGKIAFGKDHPFARIPDYNTVKAIKRADLLAWHKEHVYPNRIIIGVSGDFDVEVMEKRLRREFESWTKGPDYVEPKFTFQETHPGVYFVEKEDVTQANIRLVQLGQVRKNPDFYAIEVLNQIISGNSLTGRLFESIRTKQGLAYSVYGSIGSGWKYPSIYKVSLGTDNKNAVHAVQAVYQELDLLLTQPPSQEEIQRAKDQILNSFVFKFEDKAAVLYDQMLLEFYGYPKDYTQKYPEEIKKITGEDVKRVVQKYTNAKGFAVLIVGKEKDFEKPLSTLGLGPITVVDPRIQTGPEPVSKPHR